MSSRFSHTRLALCQGAQATRSSACKKQQMQALHEQVLNKTNKASYLMG